VAPLVLLVLLVMKMPTCQTEMTVDFMFQVSTRHH